MDSFKGSKCAPSSYCCRGTVHTEEQGMGCNGLPPRERKCALCSSEKFCWEEQSMQALTQRRSRRPLSSLGVPLHSARTGPWAAAAAVGAGSLHTGTGEAENSPPHTRLLLDTRFHLKKGDVSDSFNAMNRLVLFLLQSVTGKAFLWVIRI